MDTIIILIKGLRSDMGVYGGPIVNVAFSGYRYTPNYTPSLLIQVESAGNSSPDKANYKRQRIVIDGTQVLSASSPRSYRATQLRPSGETWTYVTSSGIDVYGSDTNANKMNLFLTSFERGDLLVMNTYDEPNLRRGYFTNTLINDFNAQLTSSITYRCGYVLVAVKGYGVYYESVVPISVYPLGSTIYL